jgi:SOS response regulatory protein OraA/RecX
VHEKKSQNITHACKELHDLYCQMFVESCDQLASYITNRRVKTKTFEILVRELEHEGVDKSMILTMVLIREMESLD